MYAWTVLLGARKTKLEIEKPGNCSIGNLHNKKALTVLGSNLKCVRIL